MSPLNTYQPSRCNYMYVCSVAADGTFLVGPFGWTLDKTGLGVYVITHSLGTTEYLPATSVSSPDYKDAVWITASDANSITLATMNNGQPADWPFRLLIIGMSQ